MLAGSSPLTVVCPATLSSSGIDAQVRQAETAKTTQAANPSARAAQRGRSRLRSTRTPRCSDRCSVSALPRKVMAISTASATSSLHSSGSSSR